MAGIHESQHDSATAISPKPSDMIDGVRTRKRRRTGSEEEQQRASIGDSDEQQQPQGQDTEPVLPEEEVPEEARLARAALRLE